MKAFAGAVIAIDDKRILLMLNQRNELALKETEHLYGARCQAAARDILRSEADADECWNDALLQIWNSIPPAAPEDYFAYLLKTVRNIALNRLRYRMTGKRGSGESPLQLDELAQMLSANDSVEAEFDKKELLAAIKRFLQTLPQKQQALFIRRYWLMADYSDLARDFHMTVNHVKVTLSRLRKKLHDYLGKEGLL